MSRIVIMDADGIIAQAYADDVNHAKASEAMDKLKQEGARIVYPATAVAEAVTFMQRPMNSKATAYGTAVILSNADIDIAQIGQEELNQATKKYFSPDASKKNTLFDCLVAQTADNYKTKYIFSFDKFYLKKGFILVTSESVS